ncbi:MAG: tRNA pseudouridine(55) synthase TruB [Rhodothermaceae bacterium]|nr:tRNA pseudouridine(55) synthase TruB [Rhodothermaceae bacterium]
MSTVPPTKSEITPAAGKSAPGLVYPEIRSVNDITEFPMISAGNPPQPGIDFLSGTVWLVNKPAKWTSFRVVGLLRKLTGVKKVGHAGTLDPLATGLLVVCTGRATKAITNLIGADKRYECEIRLGESTPSYDSETLPDATSPFNHVTEEQIRQIIKDYFTGPVFQVPPMYSAIKHKGQPLYKYARKGEEISRPAREVHLYETRLTGYEHGIVSLDIHCSKGTYIRTIADDLGKKLGTLGTLVSLRRTAIGTFRSDDALEVETILSKLDPDGNYTISR